MNEYVNYYRKHYRYYYSYKAIKNHMIEKKIYSPSDFRYYCHQIIDELNQKSSNSNNTITKAYTSSNEDLNKLEKSYIESSIDFLFNIDVPKKKSNLLPSFSETKVFFENLVNKVENVVDKFKETAQESLTLPQVDKETEELKKYMYLLSTDELFALIDEIKKYNQ